MTDRLNGRIKFLNTEKQTGFISKPENINGNDFTFTAKNLQNISFSELKKDMEVSFLPNVIDEKTRFANSIMAIILSPTQMPLPSPQTSSNNKVIGKIKSIDIEKRKGYISVNSEPHINFYFIADEMLDKDKFSLLKAGDIVQFVSALSNKSDLKFANKIEILTQLPSPKPEIISIPTGTILDVNNISLIVDSIIENLEDKANQITDYYIFEDYTLIILKLLGIIEIYPVPQAKQAGNADGFFKIKNLEVYYDCTLSTNYQDYKKDQIENYISIVI